ncbi:GNAT family N-acetyltransferase [Mesorhizobium sp. NBSH29]|uniref:GNAT family N-acetyltransferase n=1 Tax=Mesorhizobium sp. NBSH29 TaxID=2654249 RepID=UPI001896A190|nr:GNAT family N-acetyltransferase [Mesorhizobium sp. NBSH29]QPC86010.1 GNAT family N-acetyltransferase [Mesorhizobium sp. NBSH29]
MTRIAIRPAQPDDLDTITHIYADAVLHGTATYELDPPDRSEMQQRFEAMVAGGYPYIVAEEEGVLLGYAYAGPFRPRPAYRFMVEDSIYIAPTAKGRGTGRLLLERLLLESEELGFRQMIAVIGDGTPQSASVKLHERLGFVHCGTMAGSGYKHGRWLDTVLMQYAMNGGSDTDPDPTSLPERRFQQGG